MGRTKAAPHVIFITALCTHQMNLAERIEHRLVEQYGPIELKSTPFEFSHTSYYQKEMGTDLKKCFLAFENTLDPIELVAFKLFTNQLEHETSRQGRRLINIDPGYLELPKLVLASTKNFSHRVYLDRGVYGDVQLIWREGRFQSLPWTYPDYHERTSLDFFTEVRTNLHQRIMETSR